jgi:hypothetical protein
VALVLLGSSLVVLVKRRDPAEFLVGGMLAVLVTYFAFAPRLVLPVFVLALPATVELLRDLTARITGRRAAAGLAAAALLGLMAIDYSPRRNWDLIQRRYRQYRELARAVNPALSPDARLGAVIGSHYSVFLERPVFSIQIVSWRKKTLEAAEGVIARNRLDTIILTDWTELDRQFGEYFTSRLGPPQRVGPALIWRIPKPAGEDRAG